ncbi:Heterokaryon incompatibility protein 6, OR allele [Colletotrichum siamense]|nr:Heterokaryon incompatibility protein 6, OR allele [Colletotrichum siamense]
MASGYHFDTYSKVHWYSYGNSRWYSGDNRTWYRYDHTGTEGYAKANEVPNYPYGNLSLARAEFRLIVLTPDEDEYNPIQCHLEQVSLGSAEKYVALSYCWGDYNDGTMEIMVSGTRRWVTKTLAHALQELRRRKLYRVWADQICINQYNLEERAQQVDRMADIYRYASVTMAWLGHFRESDTAIFGRACALIEALTVGPGTKDDATKNQNKDAAAARPMPESSHPLASLLHWTGLTSMFQREYWSRAWIIQEVAVSKQVEFFWNGQSVSMSDLQSAVAGCKALASTSSEANALTSLTVFEHVERLIRFRNFRESPIRLIEALILSRRAKSSDPKDKLYALKHLAIDGPDSVPFPNYGASLDDLNRTTATLLLQFYKNADIIMLPCHFLETWVPQWNDPATWHKKRINNYLTGRSNFVAERTVREHGSSTIVHKWRATRDSTAHWSTTLGGTQLQVRCKRLGRVEHCSATDAEASTAEVGDLSDVNRYGPRKVERLISLCWLLYDLIPNNDYPKPKNIKIGHVHCLLTGSVRESIQKEVPEFHKWLFCKRNLDFKIDGVPLANWLCAASDKTRVNTVKKVMRCYSSVQMEMRLFTTDNNHLGWATSSCQSGDELFLIQGCSVPIVLRKKEKGELYQLIGDSIVHGLMDGQGIGDAPFSSWPLLTLA